jgi:hypothetical protein
VYRVDGIGCESTSVTVADRRLNRTTLGRQLLRGRTLTRPQLRDLLAALADRWPAAEPGALVP